MGLGEKPLLTTRVSPHQGTSDAALGLSKRIAVSPDPLVLLKASTSGVQGSNNSLGTLDVPREPRASPKERYDRKTHKRCIKCREIKPRERFGDHNSTDGKQSICFDCKSLAGKRMRDMNVRARLRHHISTRCISQLGHLVPAGFTRDIEKYLGYRLADLVRGLKERLERDYPGKNLRACLNLGWHVDHLYPLSRYRVVTDIGVDWEEFRRCWAISNLAAIPAEDNLKKGSRVESPNNSLGDDPFGIEDEDDE